jgi:signal transduction histidine kinase
VFALVGWTALTAVAVGAEVWRGRAVMRVAAELETQLGLRCPDAWGRQEGEVLRALDAADLRRQALIHGSIWILGCLGILVALADHRRQASGEAAAERRKAEAELQLSAARRLEAVGRLSAGLAHDFNNLLAPILTVSGVVKDELHPGSPLREDLEDIRDAARKARDLVRALQTLSRRNGASLERIALASVVAESEDLLRRFAGARLGFSLHVGEGVPAVVADRPLVELALANLVVNAREGGVIGKTIRMSVGSVDVSRAEATRILVRQGRHAAVTVAEAGVDASLLSGLTGFTAAQGAAGADAGGAGFGLPTINGIVAQYGGGVVVRQASDAGWIVRLLLPEASAQLDQSG